MLIFMALAALLAQTNESANTWLMRGIAQFDRHEFSQAAISFQRAIDLDRNKAQAYKGLGMAELELKNYDAAYRSWLKAADLNPNDGKTKYYLGRLFYEANFPNEAAAWLREALKVSPDDVAATTYLGLCAEALGFDDTAGQLYRKAVAESNAQRKPFAWAYLNLANYLKKHDDETQAIQVLEEGAQKCPEAHELTALGELLSAHGQPARAETVLRKAIALDATLSQPHYRLGLLLNSLGRQEEARSELAKFQELKDKEAKAPKITALHK